ncbi:nucleotide sugar dehydrogenase [Bradyrhizobium sp.]|uniref:nucleotide sugar dehydrogenase n=1 Tax=Bradyrhizobium sp. TaxID=376 RepID=UPI003C4008D2
MNDQPRIAYVGMTHLGLCSAVAAASKGFATLGVDLDPALVGRLEAGELPVVEPDLDDLLGRSRGHISFASDPARLKGCDVIYVAPDVPTDDQGGSDLTTLDTLLKLALDNAGPDSVVVVLSQVPPGYTRARLRPDKNLYYQVETLVFGRAVERATLPERFMVGCPDPAQPLPARLKSYLEAFGCPILPMRLESAELAKISINCCLVASVTVANTLAELCERIGADWSEIAPALKLDRRIGAYSYLSPGLGIAGGNLERDLSTVIRFSQEFGTDAAVIQAFVHNSRYRKDWAIRTMHEAVLWRGQDHGHQIRLGVLGLAYKENTHSVKNSPSLALIRLLHPWALQVYDPVVKSDATDHPNVTGAETALAAAAGVDALAIMTPWPEFRKLSPAELAKAMRGNIVLDPFRVLEPKAALAAGLDYRTLGVT